MRHFLTGRDGARMNRVGRFFRQEETLYNSRDFRLKTEIDALPPGPLPPEAFQQLLVKLVNSPSIASSRHGYPAISALLKHGPAFQTVNTYELVLEIHAHLADVLATSTKPISPEGLYQFCLYVGKNHCFKTSTWVVYRALEKYLQKSELPSESIKKALTEYLTGKANELIREKPRDCLLREPSCQLNYIEIDIDPRLWFGCNDILPDLSLWTPLDGENPQEVSIPELLVEVLWTRIQSLRAQFQEYPWQVDIVTRAAANFPLNFTLPLAKRITDAQIFLHHNGTINPDNLAHPEYAKALFHVSPEQLQELEARYPNSVTKIDEEENEEP